MRVAFAACVFVLGYGSLLAQSPAPATGRPATPNQTATPAPAAATPAQPAQLEDSDLGFSYSLNSDWETVAPPDARNVNVPFPELVAKKGDACVEVVFTAKRGTPASAVVVMALPFACFGQAIKPSDLENFGSGAAEGLKQTFEVTGPVQGNYMLGSHAVWIERSKGTPKGHPGNPFIFETACTVLEKGAVCWLSMAADWHSLRSIERAPVTLDGEIFPELVPANAFIPGS